MDASTVGDRISCLRKRLDAVQSELNFLIDYLVRQAGDEWYKQYRDYKEESTRIFLQLDYLLTVIYDTYVVELHTNQGGKK